MLIYIFKYIQLCPLIPVGPHFNKSSAVITWQNANFALYCLFWESSVNVHYSFRSDNSPDKILCLQMPQLYPSQVHQQSQHWSCKLCILSLSLSKLREQFQKTFVGLVLENETEKQQYTFFFSLNIMFADSLDPPVTRSSAVITIKIQTQHPFVVFDFEIAIRQTYIV